MTLYLFSYVLINVPVESCDQGRAALYTNTLENAKKSNTINIHITTKVPLSRYKLQTRLVRTDTNDVYQTMTYELPSPYHTKSLFKPNKHQTNNLSTIYPYVSPRRPLSPCSRRISLLLFRNHGYPILRTSVFFRFTASYSTSFPASAHLTVFCCA
jgi:hypothetical protein